MARVRIKDNLPTGVTPEKVEQALQHLTADIVRRIHALHRYGLRPERISGESMLLSLLPHELDLIIRNTEVIEAI